MTRMETPPSRVEDMTVEAYEDFVSEMHAAVREEAPLYEIPLGATDLLSTGEVRHGPWRPMDCARILLRWHEAGLLGLYRYTPTRATGADLTTTEAREILSEHEAWVMFADWTRVVALFLTDKGAATEYAEWQRIASRPE